eukprot:CAMPEP_0172175756 /NCGR_PEP_ID=MMETSP1050-20130122/14410_1 /TAXON_ID=233186 /ORGANISM="Cryptomonas curvata, Strain CCAP979/52" /LENGTH=101 /DNA_ID=CAMNT_0012847905 /DNA_START=35 /DNA_END=337 /DNA_ORIENTATION=-
MRLVSHTAGIPFHPGGVASCLDPVFTHQCSNLSKGFVAQFSNVKGFGHGYISCLRGKPNGHGICWPGGASGYNLTDYLDGYRPARPESESARAESESARAG